MPVVGTALIKTRDGVARVPDMRPGGIDNILQLKSKKSKERDERH